MSDHATDHGAPGAPDDEPTTEGASAAALEQKVDTIAGAVADLDARFTQLAGEVASLGPKLNELLDRHPAGLGAASDATAAVAADVATTALEPVHAGIASLDASAAATRDELARGLEAIARVAEAVERLDARTDDRLAAVRDAAMGPVSDLQAMLAARGDRTGARLDEVAAAVQALAERIDDSDGRAALVDAVEELGARVHSLAERPSAPDPAPLAARVDDLASTVQAMAGQLPELIQEVAALRAAYDVAGARADEGAGGGPGAAELTQEGAASIATAVAGEVGDRVEPALAAMLRLMDQRLAALRDDLPGGPAPAGASSMGGFEAGAVMGAAGAAWNRLEQRLDQEFDDLGRQLQAMGALIEQATASAEAAATRPVVTGDQLRHAASTVKDTVLKASRARRDRRGGPRGLNPG